MYKPNLPSEKYSYRQDPQVPAFDDNNPLIIYDGDCALCSGFIQFVIKHDHVQLFQFTTGQSELGQALFKHYNLDHINFETNLLIFKGFAYGKMSAFAQVTSLLPYPAKALSLSRLIPPPLNNWLYDGIAQNRYRLFGRTNSCILPSGDVKKRFIK